MIPVRRISFARGFMMGMAVVMVMVMSYDLMKNEGSRS